MKKIVCVLLITFLFAAVLCSRDKSMNGINKEAGFEIYVSRDIPGWDAAKKPGLNDIALMSSPFLSQDDIIKYIWSDHHIILKETAHARMQSFSPLIHKMFVVMVNGIRIYYGRFMDDLDSSVCRNPVIMLYPRHMDERNTIPDTITIQRAYPESLEDLIETDVRDNDVVRQALKAAGIFEN